MLQDIKKVEEALSQGDSLKALDLTIQVGRKFELTNNQQAEYRKLILRSLLAVAAYNAEDDDTESAVLEMLDNYRAITSGKLVGVCLLRLLAEQPTMTWITDQTWRPKVITLLDFQFAEDLYRDWKIDPNLMSHEKIPQLIQRIKESDDQLREAVQSLTSLDRIQPHRQKLMNLVNRRVGKILLSPFLPDNLLPLLGELYTKVLDYLDKGDSIELLDSHKNAVEEINRFIRINETHGTIYSILLASDIGKKLQDLIKLNFVNNKATQPANIQIRERGKKYPLHSIGYETDIGFIVVNEGPGYAYDTRILFIADDNIELFVDEVELGRLTPMTPQIVEIPVRVTKPSEKVQLLLEIHWRDFNGPVAPYEFACEIEGQRSDIDWDQLTHSDPYSLEPVFDQNELVGRKEALNGLLGTLSASRIGSAIIYGQKRVGKTSIAKALASHLRNLNYLVIYLEGGDYVDPNPKVTISSLGKKLCTQLKRLDSRIGHLDVPKFEEALSPLTNFLDAIEDVAPDRRIVFIFDEFDELPFDLYSRAPLGDAFFLTLRSISSRANIGFVIVGGEKISHILDCQGKHLNKWKPIQVDYFNRETDWTDYKELIQRPVGGSIEYTGDALNALYELTSGNPFFTKLICGYIFQMAVQRRDCHITPDEVDETTAVAIEELSANTFQHFWEDGIFEIGIKVTEKSIRRRKILIATSDVLNLRPPATSKKIAEHPLVRDIASVEGELKEFITRKVLTCNMQLDSYDFKVLLFHKWLKSRGVNEVITTFSDLDAALRERQAEEELKIQPVEVVELVRKWGTYKGQSVTEDKVRAWLDQFGEPRKQRVMFKVLQGLHFYSNEMIRTKLREVDAIVRRGITTYLEPGRSRPEPPPKPGSLKKSVGPLSRYIDESPKKLRRSDILVSYLDGPGKSGAHFARLYADEASIYVDNVVEKDKLAGVLEENRAVQAIVFVDDFVGSGESASEYLKQISEDSPLSFLISVRNVKVIFVAIVAYVEGWSHLEKTVENLSISRSKFW